MNCTNCGKKLTQKLESHKFVESGLSNVTLLNVPVRRCAECGEFEVVLPRLPELHRLLATLLACKATPLAAEEFRYLRKHLGHSSTDFAKKIGVTLETISRWESGKHPIDPPADRLVRIMVATSQPVEKYPEEIFEVQPDGQKKAKPKTLRLQAPRERRGSWMMAAAV